MNWVTVSSETREQREEVDGASCDAPFAGSVEILEPTPFMLEHNPPKVPHQLGSMLGLGQPSTQAGIAEQDAQFLTWQ